MSLKYCGYAYKFFEKVLSDKRCVNNICDSSHRLFCQFHAPQTYKMKSVILSELKTENSKIRVFFATAALGMGVDVSCIKTYPYCTTFIT